MAGKNTVFTWLDYRYGVGQIRAIVAAPTALEAARATHELDPRYLYEFEETDNAVHRDVALRKPLVVHWVATQSPEYEASTRDTSVWTAVEARRKRP